MTSKKDNSENQDQNNINELSSDEQLESANGGSIGSVISDLFAIPYIPITNMVQSLNGTLKEKSEIMEATGQTGVGDAVKWTLFPSTMLEKTDEGINEHIEKTSDE